MKNKIVEYISIVILLIVFNTIRDYIIDHAEINLNLYNTLIEDGLIKDSKIIYERYSIWRALRWIFESFLAIVLCWIFMLYNSIIEIKKNDKSNILIYISIFMIMVGIIVCVTIYILSVIYNNYEVVKVLSILSNILSLIILFITAYVGFGKKDELNE